MTSMTYFKKGDILYVGIVEPENKKLLCQQIQVQHTEGLLREAGYTNEAGHIFPEETMVQRLFFNEDGDYLDLPVGGEEVCISRHRDDVLKGLKDLCLDYPVYYQALDGVEELGMEELLDGHGK